MKVQDLFFIAILLFLIYKQNPRLLALAGLISLILSIPLFSSWVFFTAQRLVYYAAAFFAIAIILTLINKHDR